MIDTIVLVMIIPFSQRDYVRYGIQTFRENGFTVEVWDIVAILYPDVDRYAASSNPAQFEGHLKMKTREEVCAALNRVTGRSFLFLTTFLGYSSYWLYRSISKRGIPYCVSVTNGAPLGTSRTDRSLRYYARRLRFSTIASRALGRLPLSLFGLKPASIALAIGSKCSLERPEVVPSTRVVDGHTYDYDLCLTLRRRGKGSESVAVYVDNYLPFHPDVLYTVSGAYPKIDPDHYYPVLRRFFDTVEEQTGLPVVVAAHPRSDYDSRRGLFGSREVVKGRTVDLIHDSRFAILTFSTALNFVVAFKKPCLFITLRELERNIYGEHIRELARLLGTREFNVESGALIDWNRALAVDEEAYSSYQDAYIKKDGAPDRPVWQLLAEAVKGLSTGAPPISS